MADFHRQDSTPCFSGETANTSFENSLAFLISTLGNRIALLAERDIRRHLDLSYMEWRVMQIVGTEPGAAPMRIVAVTGVNKANVSRAVNSLEQRGLLYRTAFANHARHTRLHLTESGLDYYARGNARRADGERQFLAGLDDDTRQQLGESLRQVLRNVERLSNET